MGMLWSGLPFSASGDLPHPGIEPVSLMSPALASRVFTLAPPGIALIVYNKAWKRKDLPTTGIYLFMETRASGGDSKDEF